MFAHAHKHKLTRCNMNQNENLQCFTISKIRQLIRLRFKQGTEWHNKI